MVESAQVHRPAQHPRILLRVPGIESSHRFVPGQDSETNTFTLSHVLDGYAQVNGYIDQNEVATRQLVHHKGAVSRRVLSPKLDGRWEDWYGFRRGFGSKLFRLGVQPRSSMMILRHTDVSTTEAHYIIVVRTETPVAMEKLETALGKKWAKWKSQYSSKLPK